jgi:hypothetical protein
LSLLRRRRQRLRCLSLLELAAGTAKAAAVVVAVRALLLILKALLSINLRKMHYCSAPSLLQMGLKRPTPFSAVK